MSKFSILTVGEGMVAQNPGAVGAMAAGLIVTRTTRRRTRQAPGRRDPQADHGQARVLLVAGGICLLMSLVPGFPVARSCHWRW